MIDDKMLIEFDKKTPLFKQKMDNLPARERKVFCGILELGEGTSAEVATISRMSSGLVSAFLNRLVERDLVSVVAESHKKIYSVADPDFIIWYKLRSRNGWQNKPVNISSTM